MTNNVPDKIFQPFFTTIPIAIGMKAETKKVRPDEPVGRGEGLSADLSGRNEVKTEALAQAGTTFIIQLAK